MAQISVNNLTFGYEESLNYVFENVTFTIDTDWKLGFIGRNGKGKSTFLKLLSGEYEFSGSIHTTARFDYFPYEVSESQRELAIADFMEALKPGCEQWKVICELEKLSESAEILYRPYGTLSPGERTKALLAVLFSDENDFLLIDEPTNHLDKEAREIVKKYLAAKKGFILVSHDRDLLDACTDHCLVLNRNSIEVQQGNFSSWWENKQRKDQFAIAENKKHRKEIQKLNEAAAKVSGWADKNEHTKIGFDPIKEHDRCLSTRSYIGAKTKKMQSRVKQMENRIGREIEEKEGLLQDIESPKDLKLFSLAYHKKTLVNVKDYSVTYAGMENPVFTGVSFAVEQGERIALSGENGSGKTTLIKMILRKCNSSKENITVCEEGVCDVASGLMISYVGQEIRGLKGDIATYCKAHDLDKSLFCSLLRQLDFERNQFSQNIENYSDGQKKKVLLATSLLTPAHLYIWDEPLNYIDVFSRIQLENLILEYKPTILFVEHDIKFCEKVATKVVSL
ncbi:MAG: ABC-F type ribosomal protection protein [Butyribacter sp.]|nr:ABC-F type ribosomal protection protein [bacterium]MDY3855092.1 ABC-F type ribosomal protection protein [Butyribacter sp.]